MSHPEVKKHTHKGKHYVNYKDDFKDDYLGPYTDESECNRASDMLKIKLAIDSGRTTPESLADLKTFFPLSNYYKNEEAIKSVRNVSMDEYICYIKEGGAHQGSNNRQAAAQGQEQQQQQQQVLPRAQVPNRPKPAPYSPTSLATTTPGKMSIPAKRGANDLKKNEVTAPVACRKNPISGPTYHPPIIPETESENESEPDDQDDVSENSDNDDSEEIERAPKPARKNAFPGVPPLLRPRPRKAESDGFIGVLLHYHHNYAEIQIPSTSLPPSSSNSSEHSSETAPGTPLKDITVRSESCSTELEAALAHDLLLLWCSKGQVAPDPTSLNFPLSELWKEPANTLVEQARKCATHVELKAFVDELIESGELRKLVLSVPVVGGGGEATGHAAGKKQAKITRVQGRKIYEELTNSDEEEEDSEEEDSDEDRHSEEESSEEEEMQGVGQVGGQKRPREEMNKEMSCHKKPLWTEEEMNVLETELISNLGKTWWEDIGGGGGLSDVFQHIFELLEGLGYHRSGARAVEAKAMRLKEKRMKEAKIADAVPQRKKQQVHGGGAATSKEKKKMPTTSQKEVAPCPYYWTDEEMNVLESELVAELGESWWDEKSHHGLPDLYRHIAEILKGLGLGYDRGFKAIASKARKLKAKKKKAAAKSLPKRSDVPRPKRQQQQQQVYNRRAAAPAAAAASEDSDGGVSSRAAPASTVPISAPQAALPAAPVAPVAAPVAAPVTTPQSKLAQMENLLKETPGMDLPLEDIYAFMGKFVRCDEDTRSWQLDTLSKFAADGNTHLMRVYVKSILN